MADHHTRHNSLGQDALFTTPASLMLDARLTPLERNGWQVLRMLRSAEDISPLANLGQLRRARQPIHCHCLAIPLAARLFRNRPNTLAT
ncbi:MAG: hypothetical protein ACN6PF_22260 [Achromobacter veterisilvae]